MICKTGPSQRLSIRVTSVATFDVVLSTQFNNVIRVYLKKPKTEN